MVLKKLLRNYVQLIIESTPRILDLTREDILAVLNDILTGASFATYTEKLAGQFFEVIIDDKIAYGKFKNKDFITTRNDIGGVLKAIVRSRILADMSDTKLNFEVLKPENRPDYIDYIIGDQVIAIEFSGRLTKEQADFLNSKQDDVKFLTKQDIIKKPRPLPPELKEKITSLYEIVESKQNLTKTSKQAIEEIISESLIEIFGDSIFGGPLEGVFVTGASKDFKIPEKNYSKIQAIQSPIYAVFGDKNKHIYTGEKLVGRFSAIVGNPELAKSDRIVSDVRKYLEAAQQKFPQKGFRTFFSSEEAGDLLSMLDSIVAGNEDLVYNFYKTIRKRVNNKSEWVPTGF